LGHEHAVALILGTVGLAAFNRNFGCTDCSITLVFETASRYLTEFDKLNVKVYIKMVLINDEKTNAMIRKVTAGKL